MDMFQTFSEFASKGMITKLLSRERAKFAVKNSGLCERTDAIYLEQIKPLMPPRKIWVNPSEKYRPKKADRGLAGWTYQRKMADIRIQATIRRARHQTPDAPWLLEMNSFIKRIQDIVAGAPDFTMETPKILANFKKMDTKTGKFIYRPLCVYSSLETKIVLVLTYKYLLYLLDDCFHANMLFMRSARRESDGRRHTPNFMDAIRLVQDYREKQDGSKPIYVGECDIQKFYDILNHEDILACFDEMFRIKADMLGRSVEEFKPVRRIIELYLASFDYCNCVMKLNDQSLPMWKREKGIHRSPQCPDPTCEFQWVEDRDFISSGCYDEASLKRAKEEGLLGIPQGGALSGIIVNVVMQCVDSDIVKDGDPGRLFIRYCDDILLLHTSYDKCRQYLDTYHRNLAAHKLVAHVSKDVSDFKNGARTHKEFWGAKSKNVYRWGSGGGNASDWIAFVGYEMRRTGEVRIRKDKIDKMFKDIARKYFQVIHPTEDVLDEPAADRRLSMFNALAPRILDYEMQTIDRYSEAQARHLDKYLLRKVGRAARKLGTGMPEELVTFSQVVMSENDAVPD